MHTISRSIPVALLMLFGCSVGCSAAQRSGRTPVKVHNAATARQAVVDHLAKHGREYGSKTPADYDLVVEPLGTATWIVHATYKKTAPDNTSIFIADYDGVREADLQNLVYAHAQEFPASDDEKDHRRLIDSVVKLHSAQGHRQPAVFISSTKEIPGYADLKKGGKGKGRTLDADLEAVVRASWKDEMATVGGYLYYVVYTYNKMGGVVSRYKFQFNAKSRDPNGRFYEWRSYTAEHLILGTGIGDYNARK